MSNYSQPQADPLTPVRAHPVAGRVPSNWPFLYSVTEDGEVLLNVASSTEVKPAALSAKRKESAGDSIDRNVVRGRLQRGAIGPPSTWSASDGRDLDRVMIHWRGKNTT